MIKIVNLTKVFKSKKKEECVALDNISFDLPDRGLVFVVGKSGSGKTTLLSLIGTLDNITEGDILADGISLKNLKEKEAALYRNEKVAFIYQDYHLIEELSVYENIKISLDLKNENVDDKVDNALSAVGLRAYKNRYPKELSGGEKQRIAIARSIVKNSPIILADEPTGNLDTDTSIQILDMLKELSKDKLILIVSHDLFNARRYADKIVKINDGKVVDILKRNDNLIKEPTIKDNVLYLPSFKSLTKEEEDKINKNISKIKSIHQAKDEFIKDDFEIEGKSETKSLTKKYKFRDSFKLGFKLFKNKITSTVIYSFILACLINVLALSQVFSDYPQNKMISKYIKDDNSSLVLKRLNQLPSDEQSGGYKLDITEEQYESFKKLPLKGNIYKCFNISSVFNRYNIKNLKFSLPYCSVVQCDESFVDTVFGDGEKVDIVRFDKQYDDGFFLTDFEADIMLNNYPEAYKSYEDLSDFGYKSHSWHWGHANGYIKTNYKEKLKNILKYYDNFKLSDDNYDLLKDKDEFIRFCDAFRNYYSQKYAFNPEYQKLMPIGDSYDWVYPTKACLSYNGKKVNPKMIVRNTALENTLNEDELIISKETYKNLTGNFYNESTFEPFDVNFDFYELDRDKLKNITSTFEFKVVSVNENSYYNICNKATMAKLRAKDTYITDLYFDNYDDVKLILDESDKLGFTFDTMLANEYKEVSDIVSTFSNLFYLIMIILTVGILLLLVLNALKSVKEQMHNIGILKSLGTSNYQLFRIFSTKVLSISLLTSLLYLASSYPFIQLANNLLLDSINRFTGHHILDIEIISFEWNLILINIGLIFVICIISFFVEVIKLRKIKPINIMKSDE